MPGSLANVGHRLYEVHGCPLDEVDIVGIERANAPQPEKGAVGHSHGGKEKTKWWLALYQMSLAKSMAAGLASMVIEQGVIDLLAEGCAGNAARGATDQGAHDGAGHAAE